MHEATGAVHGVDEALEGDFLLAGKSTPASENWRTTQSVSSFGENGTGGWAALRVLPEHHRTWLARDQFGQKPLYYAEKPGATAFTVIFLGANSRATVRVRPITPAFEAE